MSLRQARTHGGGRRTAAVSDVRQRIYEKTPIESAGLPAILAAWTLMIRMRKPGALMPPSI